MDQLKLLGAIEHHDAKTVSPKMQVYHFPVPVLLIITEIWFFSFIQLQTDFLC